MPRTVTVNEEIYPHEYLWRSSTRLLAELERSPDRDKQHLYLPTLLTTLLSFEAFVNFCGIVLLPELWANEKENFKGKPFDAKVDAIVEKIPGFVLNRGNRPYQTIGDLFRFRDLVVHAKVHCSSYDADLGADPLAFRWDHPWDKYFSDEAAKRARYDVAAFSQSLVVAMRQVSDHPHLSFDAYQGSLGSASSVSAA